MFNNCFKVPLFLLALLCIGLPSFVSATELSSKLTLVGGRSANDPRVQWMLSVYQEAFSKYNIQLEFLDVPPRRAIKMAKRGDVDGDIARVASYASFNPELVPVKEPISKVFFMAFSTDKSIKLTGWNDLKKQAYNVECRLGVKLCEKRVNAVLAQGQLTLAKDIEKATDKLLKGRSDIYIENSALFYQALATQFPPETQDRIFEAGMLEEVTIHLHLHKKHQALAVLISNTLAEMKAQGRFEYYRKQHDINVLW